ncbi:MAG: hypothetical protein KC502_17515, partial [Myxococcales bacterium]|nr:hypothetical protein [Myxococcales bacterium]
MVSSATATTIFVAKLHFATSTDTVRNAFEHYGKVDSVKVILDRDTGRSKGFGFVEMPDKKEAWAAIDGLNGSSLDGRSIIVKVAAKRGERGARGTRGARGGGYGARGAKPPARGGGYSARGAKPPAKGA